MMPWAQNYDPAGLALVSSAVATVPVLALLGGLGVFNLRAHTAALVGLAAALAIAIGVFGMPTGQAMAAAGLGAANGLLPIGWIVLNTMFLYRLTEEHGAFATMRDSISRLTRDARLQLLLIAFCFGAFFEGAAGFGTPVAVTGAMLIGLGFSRLQASGLSLIANTAPVAFGALGTPLLTLAAVTGLPVHELSMVVGRLMAPFCLIVPVWLVVAFGGWRRALEVWPALVVTGASYAGAQLLISNLHGPWLAAVVPAIFALGSLVLLLRWWQPATVRDVRSFDRPRAGPAPDPVVPSGAMTAASEPSPAAVRTAWQPWILLTAVVFVWGIPTVKAALDALFSLKLPVRGLNQLVLRMPPVVPAPQPEAAVYAFAPLSATGTAILISALFAGAILRIGPKQLAGCYWRSLRSIAPSLLTITAMLALGYVTRYSGVDAAMGLGFAATGGFYPFFGTMLGWLGVAVTGSDTASNVLFGSLQTIAANRLGYPPLLMAAANSAGGVMGKMVDAQSIVVASTATRWTGAEGKILRYVLAHSIVLGATVGALVLAAAYVPALAVLVRP